ncbi:hypothetical protein Leryth_022093 [Lithospermum erythrorhizon]|nr:hypothetical protein Leryth_022093 [Lithospermum erythrorhizon]
MIIQYLIYLRESTSPMAYGFWDAQFDTESSSLMKKSGSFYLFIPQIEINESEDISTLMATIAWDDSFTSTLMEAIKRFQYCLEQIMKFDGSSMYEYGWHSINSSFHMSSMLSFSTSRIEHLWVSMFGQRDPEVGASVLKGAMYCTSQFSIRLSPIFAISNNMYKTDQSTQLSSSIMSSPNINSLWATLIVEECTRLGLTYFCVAPGSRSSPLAIAASSHHLTTCIACIDERSLAFHALGYARGSHRPAIVITSSGTAVSNLLPAVVEASQDFVPLLLLTADRPPELHDVGANQAVNQVNHFGQFVRHFIGLPPPSDNVSARMVLTSIDYAAYKASSVPYGPVHVNCPFREPLGNGPSPWDPGCSKGLEFWMSTRKPFTSYITMQYSLECPYLYAQMDRVLEVIQGANRGILLLASIHNMDDIWSALLLAKHLKWPVVVDILSGLRLRKSLHSFSEMEHNIVFIDHLDHLLLSDQFSGWMKADVVVQVGSRITSKRISQMLERFFPFSYILVDRHPSRHDPSHIITHRIQCDISQFANYLIKTFAPKIENKWRCFLEALEMMVLWELGFRIHLEDSLTEPYVAHLITKLLHCQSAMFLGNSMPIRDVDMYGCSSTPRQHNYSSLLSSGLPCHGILVAGNRGASGIDGLLSTAIGFAVGSNRNVLCVIGDVSLLHDTNGLSLLIQRIPRRPMVIVVINNHGGAIFSLLPIATTTEQNILDRFFYTSHNVSIQNLCMAHGVNYMHAQTKMELQNALHASQEEEVDSVIEIESSIEANAGFHGDLRNCAREAADKAFHILCKSSVLGSNALNFKLYRISKMMYCLYRFQLCAPPTTTSVSNRSTSFYREGFIIMLTLEDGSTGLGEVAPLETDHKSMQDIEEQLQFLVHIMEGVSLDYTLTLLKGSFSYWIQKTLGIPPSSIHSSVRCGLEMAILTAIAVTRGSSLLEVLHPLLEERTSRAQDVQICALVDSTGRPEDISHVAGTLVEEGFNALKIKVGRRLCPTEDGDIIQEIRKKVGDQVVLRADANRAWTYDEAIQFANSVRSCNLQYIEEPLRNEDHMIKFCEETGLPVALDESISNISEDPLEFLKKFTHQGIVALVIKPSIVGGFENAALMARWAHLNGKMAVISSAFESGLGLSAYIQFSRYLDLQNEDAHRFRKAEGAKSRVAHGLGTYRWLKDDVIDGALNIYSNPASGSVEASVIDAGRTLQKDRLNHNSFVRIFTQEDVHNFQLTVQSHDVTVSVNVIETGQCINDEVLVFLHGFLGTARDWVPIMKALSRSTRCIAIDLPGHGGSTLQTRSSNGSSERPRLSVEVISDLICKLADKLNLGRVILVGYSMGARIALYMALKLSSKVQGAVIVSGSPGLTDPVARKFRRVKDDFRASSLDSYGLKFFLDTWYAEPLWDSLRSHPHFKKTLASRFQHNDVHTLAGVLSDLSIGRQR